jgi:hypothetical protein
MIATFSSAVIVNPFAAETLSNRSAIEFGRPHDRKTTLHLITVKRSLVRRCVVEMQER